MSNSFTYAIGDLIIHTSSHRRAINLFLLFLFFFFNDTATTEIYTLSLHDALPICVVPEEEIPVYARHEKTRALVEDRSEEHTSELQSRQYLVCRLLLEKKKKHIIFKSADL